MPETFIRIPGLLPTPRQEARTEKFGELAPTPEPFFHPLNWGWNACPEGEPMGQVQMVADAVSLTRDGESEYGVRRLVWRFALITVDPPRMKKHVNEIERALPEHLQFRAANNWTLHSMALLVMTPLYTCVFGFSHYRNAIIAANAFAQFRDVVPEPVEIMTIAQGWDADIHAGRGLDRTPLGLAAYTGYGSAYKWANAPYPADVNQGSPVEESRQTLEAVIGACTAIQTMYFYFRREHGDAACIKPGPYFPYGVDATVERVENPARLNGHDFAALLIRLFVAAETPETSPEPLDSLTEWASLNLPPDQWYYVDAFVGDLMAPGGRDRLRPKYGPDAPPAPVTEYPEGGSPDAAPDEK